MTITEKDVENTNGTKTKKKWKKIILIVLAVWIGLGIVGSLISELLDAEKTESKTVATSTKGLSGFANIKFGTKKEDVLKAMEKAGWTQINEGIYEMRDNPYQVYIFEKSGFEFAKHEVYNVGLIFEKHDYFMRFSIAYDTANMSTEELTKLLGDCTSISDFKLAAKNPADNGDIIYGYQNSSGDICTVYYVENSDILAFEYTWQASVIY